MRFHKLKSSLKFKQKTFSGMVSIKLYNMERKQILLSIQERFANKILKTFKNQLVLLRPPGGKT